MGSHADVHPVFPKQQNRIECSIANRAAEAPQRHISSTPSPLESIDHQNPLKQQ
jgi:hypothetical protein